MVQIYACEQQRATDLRGSARIPTEFDGIDPCESVQIRGSHNLTRV